MNPNDFAVSIPLDIIQYALSHEATKRRETFRQLRTSIKLAGHNLSPVPHLISYPLYSPLHRALRLPRQNPPHFQRDLAIGRHRSRPTTELKLGHHNAFGVQELKPTRRQGYHRFEGYTCGSREIQARGKIQRKQRRSRLEFSFQTKKKKRVRFLRPASSWRAHRYHRITPPSADCFYAHSVDGGSQQLQRVTAVARPQELGNP